MDDDDLDERFLPEGFHKASWRCTVCGDTETGYVKAPPGQSYVRVCEKPTCISQDREMRQLEAALELQKRETEDQKGCLLGIIVLVVIIALGMLAAQAQDGSEADCPDPHYEPPSAGMQC